MPQDDKDNGLMTSKQVREFFQITEMSLWRWERNEALAFPEPVVICRRKYYPRAEIEAFANRQRQTGKVA
jgi:hypothetical protein